jgi:hypothetical protein
MTDLAVGIAATTRPSRLSGADYRDHDITDADVRLMNQRELWEREKRIQGHMLRVRREERELGLGERTLFDRIRPARGPGLFEERQAG